MLPPGNLSQVRRYRSNPIELGVFAFVFMILVNSVYHLLYDQPTFTTPILTRMNSNPISENRTPASIQSGQSIASNTLTFDFSCNPESEEDPKESASPETTAAKIRFKGTLCRVGSTSTQLLRASIVNTANQSSATVFSNGSSELFSTDYIPLKRGENLVRFEFSYQGGKTDTREIKFIRN
jgi:hypothetical protein